jgi:hypothetical protein
VKIALAVVLAAVGILAGLLGFSILQNLWADYQDSPTSTYLLFGLPPLVLGLGALYGAATLIRRA